MQGLKKHRASTPKSWCAPDLSVVCGEHPRGHCSVEIVPWTLSPGDRLARFRGKCTNSYQHVGDMDTDQCEFEHVLSITLWVINECTRVSQNPKGTKHYVMAGCTKINQHVDEVNTDVAPETCPVNNATCDYWVY